MEVRYGGAEHKDPTVVLLRVENTGKESVRQEDFVSGEAVEIQYKSNPPIHVRVVGTSFNVPTDNWGELTYGSKVLRVLPYLSNPRQYIDIQMLFERSPGEITVEDLE
jgi:hypothetical protein